MISVSPPPVRGIGTTGGFKMEVQDVARRRARPARGRGADHRGGRRQQSRASPACSPPSTPARRRSMPISTASAPKCSASTPTTCSRPSRSISARNMSTTSTSWAAPTGSRPRPTATSARISTPSAQLKTRNAEGEMVPLSSVASFRDITGPYRVEHFNLFPAAAIQGGTQPGYSTGYGLAAMERIAQENSAGGLRLFVDRDRLPGEARGQHGDLRFPRFRGVRVPAARRAI